MSTITPVRIPYGLRERLTIGLGEDIIPEPVTEQ